LQGAQPARRKVQSYPKILNASADVDSSTAAASISTEFHAVLMNELTPDLPDTGELPFAVLMRQSIVPLFEKNFARITREDPPATPARRHLVKQARPSSYLTAHPEFKGAAFDAF
jgi:hypothetical protein